MREEKNIYGIDMSESSAYYFDYVNGIPRYKLKRDYKECGHLKIEDCTCVNSLNDKDFFEEQMEGCFESALKSNRRLLLTLR